MAINNPAFRDPRQRGFPAKRGLPLADHEAAVGPGTGGPLTGGLLLIVAGFSHFISISAHVGSRPGRAR